MFIDSQRVFLSALHLERNTFRLIDSSRQNLSLLKERRRWLDAECYKHCAPTEPDQREESDKQEIST